MMKWSTNVQIVNSENIAVYMSKYITVTRKDYIREGWKPDEREITNKSCWNLLEGEKNNDHWGCDGVNTITELLNLSKAV